MQVKRRAREKNSDAWHFYACALIAQIRSAFCLDSLFGPLSLLSLSSLSHSLQHPCTCSVCLSTTSTSSTTSHTTVKLTLCVIQCVLRLNNPLTLSTFCTKVPFTIDNTTLVLPRATRHWFN